MRPNNPKTYSLALSGWGFWIGALAIGIVLSKIGLGWMVAALLVLLVFLLSLPILVLLGVRWWLRRTIATDTCPICNFQSEAIEGSRFSCPSCGEPLYVADGQFFRQTARGVVEVDYIDEGEFS
ncbi:hypothetical protein [Synechococcus sp. PCC 7336]|uniref:hypothetical protein n=1 Tax=Synechococcus sp. PCC 7336 TaxID=195250 RepID=UPI00034B2341|nr:hypothetical protein [Synechococcus sp. PCC 7336]